MFVRPSWSGFPIVQQPVTRTIVAVKTKPHTVNVFIGFLWANAKQAV
jgi:hypothetical protein